MIIANPIYDSVFKYLLDDNEVARVLISNLLDIKIESLHVEPTETIVIGETRDFTVFRIDFKATISLENNEKQVVLIEIQKAKLDSDILRFRKYLGAQYLDNKNTYPENSTKAYPIYTIYFLGHELAHSQSSPIINVNREYIDNYSKQKLAHKEEFIECLTHNSIVIQIPLFKKFRRNRIEKLLSIFEASTRHEVDVFDEDDSDYKLITRRLVAANADSKVRQLMDVEDEIIEELAKKDRAIAEALAEKFEAKEQLIDTVVKLEETKSQLGETESKLGETVNQLGATKSQLSEAESKLGEAESKLGEAESKLGETELKLKEAELKQQNAIKLMLMAGISKESIAQTLNINIDEIE